MNAGWLEEREWRRVQETVPIACVDALPIQPADPPRVGLILRDTPHQGQRWCLIGGRVRRGESLADALVREWRTALGESFSLGTVSAQQVVEYLPDAAPGQPHDPRQHSISVTYAVMVEGEREPEATGGEAHAFRWFEISEATAEVMGFGQEALLLPLLSSAGFEVG